MTSNEILKADVLDILFENRNKQYGAYDLRRTYNTRLLLALGSSVAAVFLACLLVPPGERANLLPDSLRGPVVVTRLDPIPPPLEPTPPPAAQAPRPVATVRHTSQIEIVREVPPDQAVPEVSDLVDPQIGTANIEGDLPTVNHTVEAPPAPPSETVVASNQDAGRFVPLERQPEFPGGVQAWSTFLGRHLVVPEEMEPGERRTVQVKFWVGVDGSVTRFEVVQSAGAAFDNEVIRVLKKMPRWKPAVQNGQPIAVTFTQPVTFQAFEE